jgi:hypothetical protein
MSLIEQHLFGIGARLLAQGLKQAAPALERRAGATEPELLAPRLGAQLESTQADGRSKERRLKRKIKKPVMNDRSFSQGPAQMLQAFRFRRSKLSPAEPYSASGPY